MEALTARIDLAAGPLLATLPYADLAVIAGLALLLFEARGAVRRYGPALYAAGQRTAGIRASSPQPTAPRPAAPPAPVVPSAPKRSGARASAIERAAPQLRDLLFLMACAAIVAFALHRRSLRAA